MTRRYCLTLDLKDDPKLIADYKAHHESIWPEVAASMEQAGIVNMEIYLLGTRMFMIMEVNESFSFEIKRKIDNENPKVRQWEELMWKFQQALPEAAPGEKWLPMDRIFKLRNSDTT
jgi:L-rhamnose mutarotase